MYLTAKTHQNQKQTEKHTPEPTDCAIQPKHHFITYRVAWETTLNLQWHTPQVEEYSKEGHARGDGTQAALTRWRQHGEATTAEEPVV